MQVGDRCVHDWFYGYCVFCRIEELEEFKTHALGRLERLSSALTRIECEVDDRHIQAVARSALYEISPRKEEKA